MSSVNASPASGWLWICVCFALAACVSEPAAPVGDPVTSVVEHKEIPVSFNAKLDVLFVIDSSPQMAPAQAKLVAGYRQMIDVLAHSVFGGLPDIQIGVTTADLADHGRLRRDTFLAESTKFAWRQERNYTGALDDAFVDLASVGVAGQIQTRPLDAMLAAVDPAVNPGFVRDDAYLAVVILTVGDDQGTTAIAEVATALEAVKSDPARVMISGGFGACTSGAITAIDAPRLAAFADQFPNRNVRSTLCEDDLGPLLALTQQLFKTSLGLACIEGTLRTPHDCAAWLVDPLSPEQASLPECASPTDARCWSLRSEPAACPVGGGQALHFQPVAFPFPATAIFECVVEKGV